MVTDAGVCMGDTGRLLWGTGCTSLDTESGVSKHGHCRSSNGM